MRHPDRRQQRRKYHVMLKETAESEQMPSSISGGAVNYTWKSWKEKAYQEMRGIRKTHAVCNAPPEKDQQRLKKCCWSWKNFWIVLPTTGERGEQQKRREKQRQPRRLSPKIQANTNGEAPKEKVERRRKTRPPAPPIKPTEGKIREAVKGLMRKNDLISSLEPTCFLEMRNFDRLTEKNEIGEVIKRECPQVTNARIGITSAKSRRQKLAVVDVPKQYAGKFLNSGKIRISWILYRIRIRAAPSTRLQSAEDLTGGQHVADVPS